VQHLSAEGLRRLDTAHREVAALFALDELRPLLDPEDRGRYWCSRELAARLARFEATAWPRIRAGHREPRNRLEELLATVAGSDLPRSADRLFKLLSP